jgi:type VI secretion system protein ImpH
MSQLAALTRSYVGPALDFDVQLTLKAAEIPALALSADPIGGGRLGWNTWLPTTRPRSDASDAIFRPESAV